MKCKLCHNYTYFISKSQTHKTLEGCALKGLMAWHILAMIASIIAIIKSSILYSRDPNEISKIGQIHFCTLGELFSINLICCVVGLGK